MVNQIRNLASAIVRTGPGKTGTTMVVEDGYGGGMPDAPFFLTATPPGQLSTRGNSEIVLVTALNNDTMTIVRAQKETSAKDISAGWSVSNSVYVESSAHVGDIVMTLNSAPDLGRLFMDGGTYNKSDYPLLYDHVKNNSAYGVVTSTTFTLADMRTRMPVGSGTGYNIGAKGGFEKTRHVNTLWGIAAGAFRHSGTKYLNSIKPLLDQWLTGDGSSSELTYKSSVANVGGTMGQEGDNPIERLWYEYTSSNMPPYIAVNFEVIAG